jgi:hypothetical protein
LVGHRRRLLDAIAALGTEVRAAAVRAAPCDAPAQAEAERRDIHRRHSLTLRTAEVSYGFTAMATGDRPFQKRPAIRCYSIVMAA